MKKNRLFMIGVISACLLGLCACGGSSKTGNEGTEEKEASAVNTESPEKKMPRTGKKKKIPRARWLRLQDNIWILMLIPKIPT